MKTPVWRLLGNAYLATLPLLTYEKGGCYEFRERDFLTWGAQGRPQVGSRI